MKENIFYEIKYLTIFFFYSKLRTNKNNISTDFKIRLQEKLNI